MRHAADEGTIGLSEAFECLVATIQEVRAHSIGKYSLIWEENVGSRPLYEWLFHSDIGIDPEVAFALRLALDRTPDWDAAWDATGIPSEVSIDGVTQNAVSVSAAARETHEGRATGCLSCLRSRSGRFPVGGGAHVTDLHFIALPRDILAFFRDVPEVEALGEDAYFENAAFAFPNVHFTRERTHFGHFDERYETIRCKVTAHLAVLNDYARAILETPDPADAKQARFGSYGINASTESAQTKANRKAMRQREVSVAGLVVVCDWHTKLRPHIDRIYFNATASDRVVVGSFRDHLD